MSLVSLVNEIWYQDKAHPLRWLLEPLSWLYGGLWWLKRMAYRYHLINATRLSVPVIVVGNFTVGGTGKTPLIIYLARQLKQQGLSVGIISRGYGSRAPYYPYSVDGDVIAAGDEPLLMAQQTQCPVVIDANRVRAGRYLLSRYPCDLLLSDDGLQHLALQRTLEIVVIDGKRRLGNSRLFPLGPCREAWRPADLTVIRDAEAAEGQWSMQIKPSQVWRLDQSESVQLSHFAGQRVHAVAGIGYPRRFFDSLIAAGLILIEHPFADHHQFVRDDFNFGDNLAIVMTEKDAVKCRPLALAEAWSVQVDAVLAEGFMNQFNQLLQQRTSRG